jgi:hypothetical protein
MAGISNQLIAFLKVIWKVLVYRIEVMKTPSAGRQAFVKAIINYGSARLFEQRL